MSVEIDDLRRENVLFGVAVVLVGALAFWRELQSGSFGSGIWYWLFDSGLLAVFLGVDFLRRQLRSRTPDGAA